MQQSVLQHLRQMHEAAIGMAVGAAGISKATSDLIALVEDDSIHTDAEIHELVAALGHALAVQAACIERIGALVDGVSNSMDALLEVPDEQG